MAIQTAGRLPYQQDRSITKMFYDEFTAFPPQWSALFKKEKWPKGPSIVEADIAGLGGSLTEAAEGEAVEFDVGTEGNKVTRVPKKFQKGFQVTEEAIEDELFGKIAQLPKSLARVAKNTIEVQCAAVLNGAFGTSLGKDGHYLCYASHATTRGGSTINNLSTADLDTTSLQAAMQYFQTLVGEDDLPIQMFLRKLVVPISEQWKANELLRSTGRVFDTGGAVYNGVPNKGLVNLNGGYYAANGSFGPNMLHPSMGVVPAWDVFTYHYLTDSDSWFALSGDADLRCVFKREVRLEKADDVHTGNTVYRCSTRFLPFMNEYRGIYGSAGA